VCCVLTVYNSVTCIVTQYILPLLCTVHVTKIRKIICSVTFYAPYERKQNLLQWLQRKIRELTSVDYWENYKNERSQMPHMVSELHEVSTQSPDVASLWKKVQKSDYLWASLYYYLHVVHGTFFMNQQVNEIQVFRISRSSQLFKSSRKKISNIFGCTCSQKMSDMSPSLRMRSSLVGVFKL
jgi:hypothetical protein